MQEQKTQLTQLETSTQTQKNELETSLRYNSASHASMSIKELTPINKGLAFNKPSEVKVRELQALVLT
ncbi:hypothetical protein HpCOL12_15440 [Helicobacter pylori]